VVEVPIKKTSGGAPRGEGGARKTRFLKFKNAEKRGKERCGRKPASACTSYHIR
jgi:hypothetical protein